MRVQADRDARVNVFQTKRYYGTNAPATVCVAGENHEHPAMLTEKQLVVEGGLASKASPDKGDKR